MVLKIFYLRNGHLKSKIILKIIADNFLRTNSTSAAWPGGGGEGGQEEGAGGGEGGQGQYDYIFYIDNSGEGSQA